MNLIQYFPLKYIEDERGAVLHFLKREDTFSETFGECYFSWINPRFIKGWYRHSKSTSLMTSPTANLQIVLYDSRPNSSDFGKITQFKIQKENYGLLKIPVGVWYSFKSLNDQPALVANFLNNPHDAKEVERLPSDSAEIPFNWKTDD